MWLPWNKKIQFEDDPLWFSMMEPIESSKWVQFWYNRWQRHPSSKDIYLLILNNIYNIAKISESNPGQTLGAGIFQDMVFGVHFTILSQQYTVLEKMFPHAYRKAEHNFLHWVSEQGYVWNYDITLLYPAFSHSIILFDYYRSEEASIRDEHWYLRRWLLLLSGCFQEEYVKIIPLSWFDALAPEGRYVHHKAKKISGLNMNIAMVYHNLSLWFDALAEYYGFERILYIFKVLFQDVYPISDVERFMVKRLHRYGYQDSILDIELMGFAKFLKEDTRLKLPLESFYEYELL